MKRPDSVQSATRILHRRVGRET